MIIAGGTNFYIRPHLALSAPAYGTTGGDLEAILEDAEDDYLVEGDWQIDSYFTKMAGGESNLDTNHDVSKLLDSVIANPETKILFMPVALCDFEVTGIRESYNERHNVYSGVGKHLPRLKTNKYYKSLSDSIDKPILDLELSPADKIINKVRRTRKDIFLVGFKTTSGASEDEQFEAGLNLLKSASCNLVLANDISTRVNMVVTPEQSKYAIGKDRRKTLETLCEMAVARSGGTFTRSTVVDGTIVPWESPEIPNSLRTVVNHAIQRGAYRPFNGKTVGHFAVKVGDGKYLTSIRKTNFNDLLKDPASNGLVKVEASGNNEIIAYGAKPSVGGQSQRIIFNTHKDVDCVFHAHIQIKPTSKIPNVFQWMHECGSHGCGQNTADNLKDFDGIKAVFLEKHGPNIVFHRDTDPQKVISFIEDNFYLDRQTSELS